MLVKFSWRIDRVAELLDGDAAAAQAEKEYVKWTTRQEGLCGEDRVD